MTSPPDAAARIASVDVVATGAGVAVMIGAGAGAGAGASEVATAVIAGETIGGEGRPAVKAVTGREVRPIPTDLVRGRIVLPIVFLAFFLIFEKTPSNPPYPADA
jgi:hypothetical protein